MNAPRIPSFFKSHAPKRFEYQPRYYDERKERLAEMKKKYEETGDGEYRRRITKENFREAMRSEWRQERGNKTRSSNLRLAVIVAILALIAYLILNPFSPVWVM